MDLTGDVAVDYDMLNESLVEGTVLTYDCDNDNDRLTLTGNIITCTSDGTWSTDPREILCLRNTIGEF